MTWASRKFIFSLFVVSLVSVLCHGFQMQSLIVSCDSTTINTVANYTFIVTRSLDQESVTTPWDTELVPAGSNLIIKFPSDYNTSYGYTSEVNGVAYPIIQVGQNISITGLFPSNTALDTMTLIIRNVLNPSPAATTDEFLCYLANDYTNTTADNSASITLSPANFKNCSITFSPSTVNKTGVAMLVLATTQSDIPAGGSILVTFPSLGYWYYDVAKQSFPIKTTMTCSNTTTVKHP